MKMEGIVGTLAEGWKGVNEEGGRGLRRGRDGKGFNSLEFDVCE
jgi:hypothetical protein